MEPNNPVPSQSQVRESSNAFSVSSLFSSSWEIYKKNWKVLAIIAIVPSLINLTASALGFLNLNSIGFVILTLVLMLISFFLMIAMQAAMIDAVRKISQGSLVNVMDQFNLGVKYIPSLLLLNVIQLFVLFGSFIPFIFPAIIMTVYTSLTVYALVLDGNKSLSAFTESFSLVRGRFFAVLGRFFAIAATLFVISVVSGILSKILVVLMGFAGSAQGAMVSIVLKNAVSIAVAAFTVPFMIIYMFNMYSYLKANKNPEAKISSFRICLITSIVLGVAWISLIVFIFNQYGAQISKFINSQFVAALNGQMYQNGGLPTTVTNGSEVESSEVVQ